MRNMPTACLAVLMSTFAMASGSAALADARLIAAKPADGAAATNVRALSLSFSEAVIEQQSGIELVMTAMPGMASHAPMKLSGFQTILAKDGRTLAITLPRALPAGTYRLDWAVVAAASGGARSVGQIRFSVR